MIKYKLIVLEGMSTSGKTTVMKLLSDKLNASGYKCRGFDELQTMHRDIFTHLNPRKSLEEMYHFLATECSSSDTIIVCDRFQLSHLAITNGSSENLKEIEEAMKPHDPLLVFLEIPDNNIRERLLYAKTHRGQQWDDELIQRGQSEDEAIEWFRGTQHKLFNLYQKSSLPKVQFNTAKTEFQAVASQLVDMII